MSANDQQCVNRGVNPIAQSNPSQTIEAFGKFLRTTKSELKVFWYTYGDVDCAMMVQLTIAIRSAMSVFRSLRLTAAAALQAAVHSEVAWYQRRVRTLRRLNRPCAAASERLRLRRPSACRLAVATAANRN